METALADVAPPGSRVTVVIPVLNANAHLVRTVPTVLEAARHTKGVQIIFVDNGSTDGTLEFLQSVSQANVRVLPTTGMTISAMRNRGARLGTSKYLSFLDADCAIGSTYFEDAIAVLESTGADATGCEYALPEQPHWLEQTLHDLHYIGRDRDVVALNAGNFFITREAFDDVGGFREDLHTGEDSDIGQRLVLAGRRVYECTRVQAVHYGNPKSIGAHYRRSVWHGLGMFATVSRHRIDRPTAMLGVHILATLFGLGLLFGTKAPMAARILGAVLLQLLVPALTVLYRIARVRRAPKVVPAIVLYWVYYWARIHALVLVLSGRAGGYRK